MTADGSRKAELSDQQTVALSKTEALLIQAFRKLIYDYRVQYFSASRTVPSASPILKVEHLAEYQQLCQIAHPYITANSTRLRALFGLAKHICENNILGNFVECGFANDVSTIVLAYVIKQYSRTPRLLYTVPPPINIAKLPPSSDSMDQELPEAVAQAICARLAVSDIMITTKTEYQDIVARSPSIMGMIAFLHCNGSSRRLCINYVDHLSNQLISDAFVQIDGRFPQDSHQEYTECVRPLEKVNVTDHLIGDDVHWFRTSDMRSENHLIPPSTVEHFKRDEQTLITLISQMSPNERFQIHYLLSDAHFADNGLVRFVEIGAYSGRSLMLTYHALKRRFPHIQGFAIEPSGTPQFYDLLQRYHGNIIHLKMTSDQAAPLLRQWFQRDNVLASFIFIDGDHRYEYVRRDIVQYLPLLAHNGYIIFHDYLPPLNDQNREAILIHHAGIEPGVRQACLELIESTGQYQVLDLPLLYPDDPTQSQAHLPIIQGIQSTIRAYKKHT